MNRRNRARAIAARQTGIPLTWLILTVALVLAAMISGAHAQGSVTGSDAVPPATSPSAPAEVQPGHPPPASTGSLGAITPPGALTPAPSQSGASATPPTGGTSSRSDNAPR